MLNIIENELLSKHSTFHIGGPACYFVAIKNNNDLFEAIAFASEKKIDYKVIGGGSNLLFADAGYDGLIIKYFGGNEIEIFGNQVKVSGGMPLALAINKTIDAGLSGLEWGIGIPGTIAGAICNNAGAYGGEMAQSVVSVEIFSEAERKIIHAIDCGFTYRHSAFKSKKISGIILSAVLELKQFSNEELLEIKLKMQDSLQDRLSKSARGGSVGSVFRNIVLSADEIKELKNKISNLPEKFVASQKIPAGWLIEQCELKGRHIGGVMVSENHAGKITNVGGATASDVIMLISIIKQKVRTRFGLQLVEEFEYVGF